ncbi:MAG TPA: hypothetical protein VF101_09330 [Gaiellaceae bacterium]
MFDYRRFYAMGETFVRGAFRVHQLGGDLYELFAIEAGELEPSDALRFHHDQGSRLKDVIGTTSATVLYSDRLIGVLDSGGFTGWRTYAVEVYDEVGSAVPGYQGLVVTGRSGPIVRSLSRAMVVPPPVPAGKAMPHWIGLRFVPETWDGSDVFRPAGTLWTLVTQEVRDSLVAARLTGLNLRRVTEIEMALDEEEREEYERQQQQ